MLTTKSLIIIALVGVALQIPALAAAQTPGSQRHLATIDGRDSRQEQRNRDGVADNAFATASPVARSTPVEPPG